MNTDSQTQTPTDLEPDSGEALSPEAAPHAETAYSPAETGGSDPPAPPKRGILRRIFGLLLRLMLLGLLGLVALIAGVLLLLTYFPGNFALDQARQHVPMIEENGIDVGNLSFSIFSGVEINDIRIAPPQGYTKPIVTIGTIRLAYSLPALASNTVRIDEILLDSLHVNLETIDGKTNLDAFLENLTKGGEESAEAEPEPEPEPATEGGPPSPWRIELSRLELKNISAHLDDGERVIDFAALGLWVSGHFSESDSHFDGAVTITGGEPGRGNIRFVQGGDEPISAEILLAFALKFAVSQVLNPKATVDMDLRVASQKLETPWELEPLDLGLNLKARADLPDDQGDVDSLTLSFNGAELIRLSASLKGLMEQRDIGLTLKRLHLPLDRFAPYARAFVPGVDFGGDIAIDNLRVTGHVPDLLNEGLPSATGKILIENVWAKVADENLELAGFATDLDLNVRSGASAQGLDPAALHASGSIRLESLSHPQATVRDFLLTLDAKADGINPSLAGAEIGLRIGEVRLSDPQLGPIRLSVGLDVKAAADLAAGRYSLESLDLNVSDTIRLAAQADATLDAESGSVLDHTFRLTLHPVDLPRLMALVPPGIRKDLPAMKLAGSVGLDVKTAGAVPMPVSDPMRLPVTLKVLLALKGISVELTDPELALVVESLQGALTLEGSPARLGIDGRFSLVRFLKPDQGLTVSALSLPIRGTVTPSQAELAVGMELESVRHEQEAATLDGIRLDLTLGARGRLLETLIDSATVELDLGVRDILYAKDLTARISRQKAGVRVQYSRADSRASIGVSLGLDRLEIPEQQTTLRDFLLKLDTVAHNIDPFAQPEPVVLPTLAELAVDMRVGRIEKPDALAEPLEDTTLMLQGRMHNMRDIDLDPFRFRMPTLGVVMDMTGKVWGLMDRRMEPVDFKTRWPEFDTQIFAGIDTPQRTLLTEGVEARGKAGLSVRVRSLADNFVRVDGAIIADSFHLWNTGSGEVEREDGSVEPTRTTVELVDFNANVPLVQVINLQDMSLVSSGTNIFEEGSRGILYDTMRQYSRQQSNFHIGRVVWTHEEGDVTKTVSVDKLAMDMIYQDNTFAIDRLYLDLLGGGITGALQVQLASLPPEPLDVRVHFENQITGVNLGYLAAEDPSRVGAETELSSLINLDFGLLDRHIEGRIDITRLSLKHLDTLLHFLDPAGKDPKVQGNRDLINAWYVNLIDPKIKLVSMWIKYGNLNMDIEMDAGIIGPILKRILESSRIRRLNIVPILNAFLPGAAPAEERNRRGDSEDPGKEALAGP